MPYDISIKKVALAGATGNLGSAILKELIKSGLFDLTVLTRSQIHTFPPEVNVKIVDYSSLPSLTEALTGQDALVSSLATLAVPTQKLLIDAAVAANVKRIIPSEFGCDLKNPLARALPVYAGKVQIEEYLKSLAISGSISYTIVYCGPFLDWGLRNGFFLDFKNRSAEIYDGGDQLISVSRLGTAGKAVRRILTHPRETADRAVWVKDIDVSQNQLVALASALTPGEEWKITKVDTAALEKECNEKLAKGEVDGKVMFGFVKRAIFGAGYGGKFEYDHNQVLGIKGLTRPDLEELPRSIWGIAK
jgi:nucleoside-diphosphate-sugar epimerase